MLRLALTAALAQLSAPLALAQERPLDAIPLSERLEDPASASVEIVGHVVEPAPLEPTPERIERLRLAPGFEIDVFAEGLINPRMIAVAEDGTVYVTRRSVGDVVMLRDEDGDGRADLQRPVAQRPMMHGVAVDGDTVWLTTVEDVYRAPRRADGTLGPLERVISDLPAGGQHPNRMVVVGPDGGLFLSVGSTCNACGETDPENATILRAEPDGSHRAIFASGLRNTIGYGFHPQTGALWGMDHGIDWLGDNEQHEELNRIEEGRKYGWPYVYGEGQANPQDYPPNGITMGEWRAQSTNPVGLYVPHAAPMQMAFYDGDAFPEAYRGDAFVAMRGSWNRNPPSGYEVLRIDFENGEPAAFEPLVAGFLMEEGDGWGQMGRLAGLAQTPDGALLLSDDANGVIYRISYAGEDGAPGGDSPVEPTNLAGVAVGMIGPAPGAETPAAPEALAMEALEAREGALAVTSAAFAAGGAIPQAHAAEGENISPPLDWAEGPDETRSYALIVEDPDVEGAPFVHWTAWNIPAGVADLREAVPGAPRLPLPEGMLQGRNSHGSVGWFGMKPPQGAPAHRYHFQLFALDRELDLPHGAGRAELIEAMRGHVLAAGEIIGTYAR
jgi:Raf kinase inhibitor-like YbhB/YbcL family protein